MTLVIVSGGIDLSVLALTACVSSVLMEGGVGYAPALGVGILCGAVNGLVIYPDGHQPAAASSTTTRATPGLSGLVATEVKERYFDRDGRDSKPVAENNPPSRWTRFLESIFWFTPNAL